MRNTCVGYYTRKTKTKKEKEKQLLRKEKQKGYRE